MTFTKLINAYLNIGNIMIEFIWKKHLFGHSKATLGAEMVTELLGNMGINITFYCFFPNSLNLISSI